MSRRPSVLSLLSPSQSSPNGHAMAISPPVRHSARTPSVSQLPLTEDLDPDDLFAQYTVSEVKFVQNRLRRVSSLILLHTEAEDTYRADADAKQEELRLMVGERYRDLLQASSSIISIDHSAKRVLGALENAKRAILAQEEPPLPKQPSRQGGSDPHLRTLQLLSAHMKLLLDASEHLWHLQERKQYFTAAWLFRLSLVVHRSLVQDDERDEDRWNTQGLDVMGLFPLIQRQWEFIHPHRKHIVDKAINSLQTYEASSDETCAALLPLVLLNSQPLGQSFEILLEQRSKVLKQVLAGKPTSSPENGRSLQKSRMAESTKTARQVKQETLTALDVVCRTVEVARKVFQDTDSQPSMMANVLEYIQSDSVDVPTENPLPPLLRLTTHGILMTLPSSTHFLLLPASLQSYKPSVPSSSKSVVSQSFYAEKLSEWFTRSTELLRTAVEQLFLDVRTVKDLWGIRSSVRKWIRSSPRLDEFETVHLYSILDDVSRARVFAIWKSTIAEAQNTFQHSLDLAVASFTESSHPTDTVEFLFQAPPLPVSTQNVTVSLDLSFQKYKTALRKRLLGRTSVLDEVLKTLETCARTIQHDLSQVLRGEGEDTRVMIADMKESYQPFAESLCLGVLDKLSTAAGVPGNTQSGIQSVLFVGRVADELASSPTFVSNIACRPKTAAEFRTKTQDLCNSIIDRWRVYIVSRVVDGHLLALRTSSNSRVHQTSASSAVLSAPSPHLIRSLMSFSSALQDLSLSRNVNHQYNVAQTACRHLILQLATAQWELDDSQALIDLALLRKLASFHRSWDDVHKMLDQKLSQIRDKTGDSRPDLDAKASDYLARTQILFASLLPQPTLPAGGDKFGSLLAIGVPAAEQQFHPAIEVAKPSPRFGLLLVGSAT
ncbi:Vps51/Vps67 domain-containing protein [Mycena floridula]|nr:Vps51/Vps67 domain-containing protein [Mycena floridula]